MTPSSRVTEEAIPEQVSVPAEDWARTPEAVRELVLSLIAHVQTLEAEIATLRERVNRNSGNSSQPPSSDGF